MTTSRTKCLTSLRSTKITSYIGLVLFDHYQNNTTIAFVDTFGKDHGCLRIIAIVHRNICTILSKIKTRINLSIINSLFFFMLEPQIAKSVNVFVSFLHCSYAADGNHIYSHSPFQGGFQQINCK